MDERALAFRMDERAFTSARSGAMACEGTRMYRYAGQVVSHQQCSGAAKFRSWKSARSGMDERALALRMDERALTSARPGARACEGTRMFRSAG